MTSDRRRVERGERIDRLRTAVAAGTYVVEPEVVADAVIRTWTMQDVVAEFRECQATDSDEASSDSASR